MHSYNLFEPTVRGDLFPIYARMREESPVAKVEPVGIYALSRYEDVTAAIRDTQTYSSAGFSALFRPDWVTSNPVADSMICMDPPAHTKNRTLVSRAFTKDVLESLRSTAAAIVSERLGAEKVVAGEELDIVDDLATPLAGGVICDALGLSRELAPQLQRWVNNVARITPLVPAPEVVAEIDASIAEETRCFGEAIDERRESPRDDLLGVLCQAEIDGERLTRDQLLSFTYVLVGAGFETTIHLISKSALLLSRRPDIHQALREDPDEVPAFVEEMLRFDGPIHMLMRMTTRSVELHGVEIPAHSLVALLVAAANRDPSRFPEPDEFQIGRKIRGGLAFGHGVHVCLGAALARIEATVFLRELVMRYSKVEVGPGPLDWNYMMHVHGLNHLPLRLIA